MIGLVFLLAQASKALSLLQVQELPPPAAGDAVLRHQQHGPIETFEVPTGGMNAPGVVEGQLVELPSASGSGCARKRWTVKFRAAPGADIRTATVDGTYSTQEIAPAPNGTCQSGRYVYLNPGISVGQGWEALARLKDVTTGAVRTQFQCSDSTSSGLCNDSKAIRVTLNMLTPWVITRDAGDVVIWLGVPGSIVTEVRFKTVEPSQVVVTRKVPTPF